MGLIEAASPFANLFQKCRIEVKSSFCFAGTKESFDEPRELKDRIRETLKQSTESKNRQSSSKSETKADKSKAKTKETTAAETKTCEKSKANDTEKVEKRDKV